MLIINILQYNKHILVLNTDALDVPHNKHYMVQNGKPIILHVYTDRYIVRRIVLKESLTCSCGSKCGGLPLGDLQTAHTAD